MASSRIEHATRQNFYLNTDVPGIYIYPPEFDGDFVIRSGEASNQLTQWNSKWHHQHLETSSKPHLNVPRIPGLLIEYAELKPDIVLTLFWQSETGPGYAITVRPFTEAHLKLLSKVSGDPYLVERLAHGGRKDRKNATGQDDDDAEEGDAPLPSENVSGDIYIRTRRHHNGYYNLSVNKKNGVRYDRVGPGCNEANQFTIENTGYFHVDKDSRVEVSRFKKGWTIRFIECACVTKMAIDSYPPGHHARLVVKDASYYALLPDRENCLHEAYVNEGSEGVEPEYKIYPPWRAEVAAHNRAQLKGFLNELKRVVERNGGNCSQVI